MATKRNQNFERSYSDKTGEVSIAHGEETVLEFQGSSINGAEGMTFPSAAGSAMLRYATDILVGVGNAVLKADGGTPEKAAEKMAETLKTLQDGSFKFRAASGQGGLSEEEVQAIIADTLVSLGKYADKEAAMSKVAEVYGRTSKNAKGYTVRKDYNQLKNVPAIKAAIAKASNTGSNLDDILSD